MALTLSSCVRRLCRTKPVLGLDIGTDSVKAVELKPAGGGLRIVRSGVVPVGGGPRGEQSDEDITSAIRRLLRENQFSTKRVATAVAGESVIVRVLRIPALVGANREEMRFAVQSEAQDFIPFDMDDVVFDYQVLESDESDTSEESEVLIVAVRKDVIDRLLGILDDAGLEPVAIDVSSFALCNALSYGAAVENNEAAALVSIGAATTSIAILRNGMTRFTRDLPTAGRAISSAIANELGIPFAEAEALKSRYGIALDDHLETGGFSLSVEETSAEDSMGISHDPLEGLYEDADEGEASPAGGSGMGSIDSSSIYGDDLGGGSGEESEGITLDLSREIEDASPARESQAGENRTREAVSEICASYINDISGEIKRSFIYYENQLDGEPISRVILAGGTAQLPNVATYLSGLLDAPTELMPAIPMVDWGRAGDSDNSRSLLGVSVGLALRGAME